MALHRTLFIINGFVLILSLTMLIAFFHGNYTSKGILGFLWIAYLMYAIFQFFSFPAKSLRSIEMGANARIGDYFGYFLLMIFWPIGIWFIQPKLNRVINDI